LNSSLPLQSLSACPAPAKLNLFLHVIGRRSDGYHLLQTAFRLLDWGDQLDFTLRTDSQIERLGDNAGIVADDDLVVRAARLLQAHTRCSLGADIRVHKVLPLGGGLGGGSSDAATTLIALNRLWGTGLRRTELQALGLRLGADVPFFIFGQDAFAEGVGEQLQPLELPAAHYVVLHPGVSIATAEIFSAPGLTRNTSPIRMRDFATRTTRNDLQPVACKRYPQVQDAIDWLEQFAPTRMTGSGACIFAEPESEEVAERIVRSCPPNWTAWKVRSSPRHPLQDWLE
jgi:4-diphosphocytidyl-2-C-methyl-D-erythritol kinase